jgi:large subunit ribosomal protein L4
MQVPVMDMNGKQVKTIDLPADIFELEVNVGLMHQAYVRQMANARMGTHNTKTRSEVQMTGAKMYRQKGTGRARHGAQSAPIFVGGGVAHGPKPRKYTKNMPRKMRQRAIRCALSALARDNQLVFVDKLVMEAPKTKDMRQVLNNLVGDKSALVLIANENVNVELSVRNMDDAMSLRANYLNMRDLLNYDKVIVPLDALDVITSLWGKKE